MFDMLAKHFYVRANQLNRIQCDGQFNVEQSIRCNVAHIIMLHCKLYVEAVMREGQTQQSCQLED